MTIQFRYPPEDAKELLRLCTACTDKVGLTDVLKPRLVCGDLEIDIPMYDSYMNGEYADNLLCYMLLPYPMCPEFEELFKWYEDHGTELLFMRDPFLKRIR